MGEPLGKELRVRLSWKAPDCLYFHPIVERQSGEDTYKCLCFLIKLFILFSVIVIWLEEADTNFWRPSLFIHMWSIHVNAGLKAQCCIITRAVPHLQWGHMEFIYDDFLEIVNVLNVVPVNVGLTDWLRGENVNVLVILWDKSNSALTSCAVQWLSCVLGLPWPLKMVICPIVFRVGAVGPRSFRIGRCTSIMLFVKMKTILHTEHTFAGQSCFCHFATILLGYATEELCSLATAQRSSFKWFIIFQIVSCGFRAIL